MRRYRGDVGAQASGLVREISAHRESGHEEVPALHAAIALRECKHRIDERLVVAGRERQQAEATRTGPIPDVPGTDGEGLSVRKDGYESFAVGERLILREVHHLLAGHRPAMRDDHHGGSARRIEFGRSVIDETALHSGHCHGLRARAPKRAGSAGASGRSGLSSGCAAAGAR